MKKSVNRLAVFFILSILALLPLASADIPHLISLQGRLTDASDNPISSSTNFAFRIYDAPAGGSPLWTEFQTLSPNSLGIFNALLGSVAALNIPFNESYWLEVQVNSEILSPRQRMGSAGYALRSENPWNTTGNDIYTTNAGNVGIGTNAPTEKLEVAGNVKATAFKGDGSQLTGIASSQWANSGSNIYYNTGNVGIGTASPGQKLTVAGTIESKSGGIKFPDGSVQASAAGGNVLSVQTFTSSGTWNKPGSVKSVIVKVIGGGGGGQAGGGWGSYGSGGGAGGAGGGYCENFVDVTAINSVIVTVGMGGAGGTGWGGGGGTGGTSGFGGYCTATGGSNGAGGVGSNGLLHKRGDMPLSGPAIWSGASGGNSVYGNAGPGSSGPSGATGAPGGNGIAYGGGGGGGQGGDSYWGYPPGVGGNGANGVVIVYEYK